MKSSKNILGAVALSVGLGACHKRVPTPMDRQTQISVRNRVSLFIKACESGQDTRRSEAALKSHLIDKRIFVAGKTNLKCNDNRPSFDVWIKDHSADVSCHATTISPGFIGEFLDWECSKDEVGSNS